MRFDDRWCHLITKKSDMPDYFVIISSSKVKPTAAGFKVKPPVKTIIVYSIFVVFFFFLERDI